MRIKVIASGSDGNCYLVNDGKTKILIECGITFDDIMRGVEYDLFDIEACLVSHSHLDHAKSAHKLLESGQDIMCHETTASELGLTGYGVRHIAEQKKVSVGTFDIIPFDLVHVHTDGSDCKCLGFLIYSHVSKEKLLFATDTAYIKNRFNNLNYIMIEVNYTDNEYEDEYIASVEKRRFKSHMSLDTAVEFLNNQDLSNVKTIYALHLSEERSNKDEVKRTLQRATGKEIIIC